MENELTKKRAVILPGLAVSFLVAAVSRVLALAAPQLGGATIAILLGILLGNTVLKQESLAQGTKFAESKLLEISVVLLGATVTFQTISQLGAKGLLFVLFQMGTTIVVAYFIGKKLGFNQSMSLMMAGGNAVCGSSAIASIAPEIDARDDEKGQIITLVNLLGTVMMLTLPFLGLAVFGDNLLEKSALLGGTLQSVGQVVAGASLLSPDVVQYAMLFKIMRIMMLVVVVYIFKKIAKKPATAVQKTGKRKLPLPWYVIGFLVFCIINSAISLPTVIDSSAHFVSTWCEITALAAIGLRLDFRKFIKEGPRFMIYGLSVGAFQTVAALGLIYLIHL